jgi:hypothetical protein
MHRVVELCFDRGRQFAQRLPGAVKTGKGDCRAGFVFLPDAIKVRDASENVTA